MHNEPLNFAGSDARAGFRLHRLEVFNWGTFDRAVWSLTPGGDNSLLTGDIGSGKSTLVDALTTLLVAHNRITYNKAAGAEAKERTLYHYVRGAFKEEKDEINQTGKVVYLREERTYSVILAHFQNDGLCSGVTLAQLFWLQGGERTPHRLFVVSERPLSVATHFTGEAQNITTLRKQLSKTEGVSVFETYKDYSHCFRRLFGIDSEKALDLLYQTISMKSVGNLNDFVRTHMLERGSVDERIEELKRSFENLTQAHQAVVSARKQLELLRPLIASGDDYEKSEARCAELKEAREAIAPYFAEKMQELVQRKLAELASELTVLTERILHHQEEQHRHQQHEADLVRAIDENGGQRLQQLEAELKRLTDERERKHALFCRYTQALGALKLTVEPTLEDFAAAQKTVQTKSSEIDERIKSTDEARIEIEVELKASRERHREMASEVKSLSARSSNIPSRNLAIRDEVAAAIGAAPGELPFVGELIEVRDEDSVWQGAIERVLHSFALSVLVPDQCYEAVSDYVNRTHLRGKLVYHRVRDEAVRGRNNELHAQSLVKKLRILSTTPFYRFLESELRERFNFACCSSLADFRREPYALTKEGQLKSGGVRHEKNDQRVVSDRSSYVLGWSNKEKVQALKETLSLVEAEIAALASKIASSQAALHSLHTMRDACRDALQFQKFEDMNWQAVALQVQERYEEKEQLERSSDALRTLRLKLDEARKAMADNELRLDECKSKRGKFEQQQEDQTKRLSGLADLCAQITPSMRARAFPLIESYCGSEPMSLAKIEGIREASRTKLETVCDQELSKRTSISLDIVRQMNIFCRTFPNETLELDPRIEALNEFRTVRKRLDDEDLPRHEVKFKELLNKGTINGLALFQSQLDRGKEEIEEKIAAINRSLREIEYNAGTYIQLLIDPAQDNEIRQFQLDLRQCLSTATGDTDLYNENKFLEVKAIIDRFYGREGSLEIDRRWTEKVTDVRFWFQFSASERWREDNKEREFYSGAAGKSGGQKEKLAYTVLASALAYQFGLEWDRPRTQSFRFVLIDEAFGRGSDESTRYALELFHKLKLQLLVVTPLQKINVIEDYVRTVHFVHNESGNCSRVKNLSQAEYRKAKNEFLTAQQLVKTPGALTQTVEA